jgi:prevent-host-death family protein
MPPISYPASEMARNTSEILHKAAQHPVSITKHGKSRFVVMSQEHFDRLSRVAGSRRAMTWSELSDDEMTALENAADEYLSE